MMSGRKARHRAGGLAMRAAMLSSSLPFASSAPAAPVVSPPVLLVEGRLFGLANRHARPLPPRSEVARVDSEARTDRPISEREDLLARLLSLREDLRLLVNQRIGGERLERIALGLQFATAF